MITDVNQVTLVKSCHLISRNGFIITKIMSSQIVANAWVRLSRYQNAAATSREYAERFPRRHHPGPREIDRTGLKILENNKNIQSIISVNTNILLRRFRLKFLRIMYSTSCYKERLNFENTLRAPKIWISKKI
jgi:hypothetical protein